MIPSLGEREAEGFVERLVEYAVDAGYYDARSDDELSIALDNIALDMQANAVLHSPSIFSFEEARRVAREVL